MHPAVLVALIIAALVTAGISAILGMAGGMTLLAVMAALLPATTVVPIHGVVQLSSNGTRTWAFRNSVRWRIVLVYAPASALGTFLATLVWSGDKLYWFRPAIGLFVLAFLVWRRYAPTLRKLPLWVYPILALVVGFVAIFIGATGPLLAPFFLRDDFAKENVIATKAACQFWLHLMKIPAFLALGFNYTEHLPLLGALIVAVVAGTYAGKQLLERLSRRWFLIAFQAVLACLAIYLIVTGVAAW